MNSSDDLKIVDLVDDFRRSLKARNLSPKTIRGYADTALAFANWAAEHDHPTTARAVQRPDCEDWVVWMLDAPHLKSTSAADYYRNLQQFWRWVITEGEREDSPMAGMSPPKVPEVPVPVFDQGDLKSLLSVCQGQDFDERRDTAILRMFIAAGVRLEEMAGMNVEHLAREEQAVLVDGKGSRLRWAPYGDKAALALDRYLRERRRHPHADLPALWLGQRGRLTNSGITQMLRRRGRQAEVTGVRPHRFRHDTAHRAKLSGISEGDLMEIFGWRDPSMVHRYGRSAAAVRARAAYRQTNVEGDV